MRLKTNTKIIIAVLVAILACGCIGWISTGFTDFSVDSMSSKFEPKVNENNLYTTASCSLKSGNSGDGVIITVDDDGSIHAKGKNESTENLVYTIGTVTLNKGTYTFTAVKGASKNGYLVEAYDADENAYQADFGSNTFEITANGTEITIKLVIKPEAEINATVYPVIVPGSESEDFYA